MSAVYAVWRDNLELYYKATADRNGRPITLAVVSSKNDVDYWKNKFNCFTFGNNPHEVICVPDRIEKGNYIAAISAWSKLRQFRSDSGQSLENAVIQLIIGRGIRLSPFTQALGNCKGAFPIPIHPSQGNGFLSVAQLSEFCANACLSYLTGTGFAGVLIQWADEILIPGSNLLPMLNKYKDADVIRFIVQAPVCEELAENKEWLVADKFTGNLKYEFARQDPKLLIETLKHHRECLVGVNLGTFAVSHQFLDVLCDIFGTYIDKPSIPIDWDPYFWIALLSDNFSHWARQRDYEAERGMRGIIDLEKNYPDFFDKVQQIRKIFENRNHRLPNFFVLDLGQAFWIDIGSHRSMRNHLQALLHFDDVSRFARLLYGIPWERDKNGNTIVRSQINASAKIRNSLIIDATISHGSSFVDGGVIIGGSYGTVEMPRGGNALFSLVGHLVMEDSSSMIFRLLAEKADIVAGGRSSTIPVNGENEIINGFEDMEQIKEYYTVPMKGNGISFAEASNQVSKIGMVTLGSWYNSSARELAKRICLDFPERGL
ncbi:MAG: hypothetical protein ABFD50_15085 [Smithella sp.]